MIRLQDLVIRIPIAYTATNEVAYQLDEHFFELFEGSLLEKANLDIRVRLDKTPRHIQLSFFIQGQVELSCDRTLELFAYPIDIERIVHFKIGDENKEIDVDLYMVDRQTSNIELAQHIYDFVNLAIPMKRLHPRFNIDIEEESDTIELE